jgi:hypothetical protein
LACALDILLGSAPATGRLVTDRSSVATVNITVDGGVFNGTTVTFTVTTDANGKITKVRVGCSGDCSDDLGKSVTIDGRIVAATLTQANGARQIVEESGKGEKEATKLGGGFKNTNKVNTEGKIEADVEVANIGQSGGISIENELALNGELANEQNITKSTTVTTTQQPNPTKQLIMLTVDLAPHAPQHGAENVRRQHRRRK